MRLRKTLNGAKLERDGAADWRFFRQFIEDRRWQFAKTMPRNPHEYTKREWLPENQNEFVEAVRIVRAWGRPLVFWRKTYLCLYIDGKRYWTMFEPTETAQIINRAQDD